MGVVIGIGEGRSRSIKAGVGWCMDGILGEDGGIRAPQPRYVDMHTFLTPSSLIYSCNPSDAYGFVHVVG